MTGKNKIKNLSKKITKSEKEISELKNDSYQSNIAKITLFVAVVNLLITVIILVKK